MEGPLEGPLEARSGVLSVDLLAEPQVAWSEEEPEAAALALALAAAGAGAATPFP